MKNALNTLAHKVVDNRNVIIKRGLIVVGAVAGVILTAGAVVKATNGDFDEIVDEVTEA